MKLTKDQYDVLLKPLAAHRVAQRQQAGMKLSYLEAWDVKAHLIRIFGFGGWSADVISAELVFEDQDEKGRWNVGYKVIMRLRLHAGEQDLFDSVTYTEAAVGSATLGSRGDAHDMAIKTAESDALKRAAINLGTQFGLSLYDGGNRNDVVGHTLNPPADYVTTVAESDPEPVSAPSGVVDTVAQIEDLEVLRELWDIAVDEGWLDMEVTPMGDTPRTLIGARVEELRAQDE